MGDGEGTKRKLNIVEVFCVPGFGLDALRTAFHLIITRVLRKPLFVFIFLDREAEAQKVILPVL